MSLHKVAIARLINGLVVDLLLVVSHLHHVFLLHVHLTRVAATLPQGINQVVFVLSREKAYLGIFIMSLARVIVPIFHSLLLV